MEELWNPQKSEDQALRNSNKFVIGVYETWSSKFKLLLPDEGKSRIQYTFVLYLVKNTFSN